MSGVSPGTAHRELAGLLRHGLVERTKMGKQVFYRANASHQIFGELRSILTKTVGLGDVLRQALAPLSSRIRVAFVYGSVAAGTDRPESDVDVLVIGNVSAGQLTEALLGPERDLARKVNAIAYTEAEWRAKLSAASTFVRTVSAGPKLFLKGKPRELRELEKPGQDRLAARRARRRK